MRASDGGDGFGLRTDALVNHLCIRSGCDGLRSRRTSKPAEISILEHAAGEPCARVGGSDCRFWSLSRKASIFPLADKTARRQASKSAAFADKMGLIEISKFMDNIRP